MQHTADFVHQKIIQNAAGNEFAIEHHYIDTRGLQLDLKVRNTQSNDPKPRADQVNEMFIANMAV